MCACWKQAWLLLWPRIVQVWLSCDGVVLILMPEHWVALDIMDEAIGWYYVRVREWAVLFMLINLCNRAIKLQWLAYPSYAEQR